MSDTIGYGQLATNSVTPITNSLDEETPIEYIEPTNYLSPVPPNLTAEGIFGQNPVLWYASRLYTAILDKLKNPDYITVPAITGGDGSTRMETISCTMGDIWPDEAINMVRKALTDAGYTVTVISKIENLYHYYPSRHIKNPVKQIIIDNPILVYI